MKVNIKKLTIKSAIFSSLLLVGGHAFATTPSQITFSNETSLSLGTSIAGLQGNGVTPNTTKSVSYVFVGVGCYAGNVVNNCPIEFTDRSNGARVATVYIDSATATLTRAPEFHGNYGNEYEVTGWEASPIDHIHIVKKATSTAASENS